MFKLRLFKILGPCVCLLYGLRQPSRYEHQSQYLYRLYPIIIPRPSPHKQFNPIIAFAMMTLCSWLCGLLTDLLTTFIRPIHPG